VKHEDPSRASACSRHTCLGVPRWLKAIRSAKRM